MIGAIIGDIVGSRYEFDNIKTKDFDLLTYQREVDRCF
jgi:type I restriction enzyme M protein